MKRRLLVLSDLWGWSNAPWKNSYQTQLSPHYDLVFYDMCQLGQVDIHDYSQNALHQQFVDFGIKTAVSELLVKEKENVDILAFSVGGTIAWQAALQGLPLDHFWAISATRLRHETAKPPGNIQLIYGENDPYQPKQSWVEHLQLNHKIIPNAAHDLYTQAEPILRISADLLKKVVD